MLRTLFALAVIAAAVHGYMHRERTHPPGVLAPAEPRQTDAGNIAPWTHKDFHITPLAKFALEARVLGAERYRFDSGAALAPVDLALGWGPMSDSSVLKHVSISQSGRYYSWNVKAWPIERRAIEINSANMHLIPANKSVERTLRAASRGHIVSLSGYLVEAKQSSGWSWRSSLTREDTGNGACELIWVEEAELR